MGLFLGGGSNEGLIGVTYELVGTPGQPVLRVNPISAIFPGVTRKIMEFNTGKQTTRSTFPAPMRRIIDGSCLVIPGDAKHRNYGAQLRN